MICPCVRVNFWKCTFGLSKSFYVCTCEQFTHTHTHRYGKQRNEWNAVVACFFIDTAPNIFEYMEVIERILKPGGLLISIGPLQFHWADGGNDERYNRSIEMSYDEIKHVIQSYGFEFIHEERRMCTYARNPESMQQSAYHAVQFTARKVVKTKKKI
jgi:carnosine N-methyltransferase